MALNNGTKRGVFLALLILSVALKFGFPVQAQGRPVEVRILERWVDRTVEVRIPAGTSVQPGFAGNGRLLIKASESQLLLNGNLVLGPELHIGRPVDSSTFEIHWKGRKRKYPGMLRVRAESDQLVLLNVLPLETYVSGVVSAEMPESWPLPALRAQAVLARTLALKGGDHPGGRLCDLTHCQVYAGDRNSDAVHVAQETRGQVLTYRGALIQPLFHSTCGGERASNATIFGGAALPYLQEGTDPYCDGSPHAAGWSVRVLESELAHALDVDQLKRLEVIEQSQGGWVARISRDGFPMTGYRFWQAVGKQLGWGVLKSMRFNVRHEDNAYVFEGKGLGHGVGLCQWGAKGQADKGIPHARILGSYYPGTTIVHR